MAGPPTLLKSGWKFSCEYSIVSGARVSRAMISRAIVSRAIVSGKRMDWATTTTDGLGYYYYGWNWALSCTMKPTAASMPTRPCVSSHSRYRLTSSSVLPLRKPYGSNSSALPPMML